ncbi:tetratricopeptide repeat protein [Hydrogenispora ethanolica]|uniref:Tetratricopeptide repeat protein n=1 Tax=Hydrogenispora ethanolica TaxID=1082276 RepID=A0A4V6NGL2_HYDET|nr:tetratricopeptide repeat protein [Hydrogenispora ethanolica]TCL55852.1 tetratricopeptide repeat protein [Hydrogenispora ethanolica]
MIQVIPIMAEPGPLYLPVLARGLSDLAALRFNSVEIEAQVNIYLEQKEPQTLLELPLLPEPVWNGEELWLAGVLKAEEELSLALVLFDPRCEQALYHISFQVPESQFLSEWEKQMAGLLTLLKGEPLKESQRMYTESLEAFLAFRKGLESLSQAKDERTRNEGLESLLNAVAYDPEFIEAADILVLFLVQNGIAHNFEHSVEVLERLRQIVNSHPRIPLVLAEVYLQWGKTEKATQVLEELTDSFPDFSDGWIRRALLYHSEQRLDEALVALQNVLTVEPENLTAHDLMGAVYAGKGQPEQAEAVWEKALTLDPSRVNILTNLALLAEEKENSAQAESFYKQALQTGVEWWGTFHYYGTFCLRQKRFEEAVSLLEQAVKLNPTNTLSYQNLAFAQLQLERYKEAQESLLRLLQLASDNYTRRQTLQLLNQLNDEGIKIEIQIRKLERDWENGKRWPVAGGLLKLFYRARQHWFYWYLTGRIVTEVGLPGLAMACYHQGLRYDPGFPLFKKLGLYYWQKESLRKALPFLRQAYQLHQSDVEISKAYLQTLMKLGEVEELQANFQSLAATPLNQTTL